MHLTPALAAEARRLFAEEYIRYNGWQPGGTVVRVSEATGLSADQVRTAIWGESKVSATWRADMARMLGGLAVSDEEFARIKALEHGTSPAAQDADPETDVAVLKGELTPAQKRAATIAANKAAATDADEVAAFQAEAEAAAKVEADKVAIAEAEAAEAAEKDDSAIVEEDEK